MTASPSPSSAERASRRRAVLVCCALAALLGGAAVALGHSLADLEKDRWQLAARYTARVAFLLFVPVFAASAWHRLAPGTASRWAMRRRRALGLAFATAHTIHLGALTTFHVVAGTVPDLPTLVVGGGAFVMLYALVATSNDAAVRRLGPARWQRLHRFGVHWLWFVFTFSYAGRVAEGQLAFLPLLGLALAAFGLRVAAWRARRARRAPAGAATAG